MKETAKRLTIPNEIKLEIKHSQGCRCALCNRKFKINQLQIHHIQPVVHFYQGEEEQAARRENLTAVCRPCHRQLDYYALEKSIYLPEVIEMIEHQEYVPIARRNTM